MTGRVWLELCVGPAFFLPRAVLSLESGGNPPNFSIRAGSSLPTQVKGPPAAERTPAQRTAPATPRPVNSIAPGTSYKYAQQPPPKDNFSPIPIAYSELWPSLLENHLVVAIPGRVFQPPYPPSGTTRVASVCTIVELLDIALTPASRTSIRCST